MSELKTDSEKENGSIRGFAEAFRFSVYASKIAAAGSTEEVWEIIDDVCREAKMDGACCRCFPSEAESEPVVHLTRTRRFSEELEAAIRNTPGYLDVFLHASVQTSKPFLWSEIDKIIDPKAPQLRHFRKTFGSLGFGVIVPVFGALFRNGYFCFHAQKDPKVNELDMMILHSIAQTAYIRVLELRYRNSPKRRALSDRELEAINMVARGKSNLEVAGEMDVSVNTVNTLLRRIFEKLEVSDRVSAVMRAFALGYIA